MRAPPEEEQAGRHAEQDAGRAREDVAGLHLRVQVAHQHDQPHQLASPDAVPGGVGRAPDVFVAVLHARREGQAEQREQRDTQRAGGADDLAGRGEDVGERAGGAAGQVHAVHQPEREPAVPERIGRGHHDQQRRERDQGECREPHGPVQQLQLPPAPVEFGETESLPHRAHPSHRGCPEHRVADRAMWAPSRRPAAKIGSPGIRSANVAGCRDDREEQQAYARPTEPWRFSWTDPTTDPMAAR